MPLGDYLSFANTSLWIWLGVGTLVAWVIVRGFLDDGRWRRVLSLVVPLVPVLLAATVVALDWDRTRRSLTFTRPGYLACLGLLPLLIWVSRRSLAGLGPVRQTLAIVLRCVILTLVIAALAEAQFVKFTEKLTVIFAIDDSRSMPLDRQKWIQDYVDRVVQQHKPKDDLAGVVFFGREPRIETPPLPYIEVTSPEAQFDRDHSDIGAALKLAQGAFPEDTMKRIVLISDGNENRGDALREAVAAQAGGVTIDVLPIRYRYDQEVMVEKVTMPPDVHKGETVNLTVLVRASAPVAGTLRLFRKTQGRSTPIVEQEVTLNRGVNPWIVQQKIDEPNYYTFEARFQPTDPTVDRISTNNEASTFTYLKGEASVLVIEGTPGEHDRLVEALRQENIEVTQIGSDKVPNSLAELRPYDCVILANLPVSEVKTDEGGMVLSATGLSQRQMEMIAANTHDLGAGLIMIGGPNSFGAGGYIDTPIEKAMPVDMQIKSMKVMGKGALVILSHACEIPEGNFWEKQISKAAIQTLSYHDEAGVLQSQGTPTWVFTLQQVREKTRLLARIDRMTPMDCPDFDSLLIPARNALMKSDAMTKHVIVVSDGDPTDPSPAILRSFANLKITITAVVVGAHGNDLGAQRVMAGIAKSTGGRYYNVTNNKALPKIFQKEARVVSRPLIFERDPGWAPNIVQQTEPIAGVTGELPAIRGLVLTTPKQNELVDIAISSPFPTGTDNPVLAHWQYGLGKSVAFTSDAGAKWTSAWTGWDGYRKFWAQLVRWSLRSVESGNISVSTNLVDGKIKVIADVLDKNNQFVNFAQIQGVVIDPETQTRPLELTQVAPGRYEGLIDGAESKGTYFITMKAQVPGADPTQITTGISVPYPQEYRDLESNAGLLEQIASVAGGKTISEDEAMRVDADKNPFRHDLPPPTAAQDVWPSLLFWSVVLFLFDVGVRRISLDLSRMRPAVAIAWAYVRGKKIEATAPETMDKLRQRKREVVRELDEARAARRFESTPDSVVTESVTADAAGSARPARPARPAHAPQVTPEQQKEQDTYTSRLLKAKKKVWNEKKP